MNRITRDPAIIGKAYAIIAEGVDKYYSTRPRLAKYDAFRKFLIREGSDAYKKTGGLFPVTFYEELADAILDWAWNRFENATRKELRTILQNVWKLHRQYVTDENLSIEDADKWQQKFGELLENQRKELLFECNETSYEYLKMISIAALRNIETIAKTSADTNGMSQDEAQGNPQEQSEERSGST